MSRGGRVDRVCQSRNRQNRRRQDSQRRDQTCSRRIERLRAVAEPAHDERQPQHKNAVCDHRSDERGLDDPDEPLVQREESDEKLGQVPETRLDRPGRRRAHPAAELLRRATDESGEYRDRER